VSERFFKYQGLGNDFVILDRRASGEDISAERAQALCDRRLGIGADGVLVVLPEDGGRSRMVVHNADGSESEMCGNGLRCVVKYLVDHGRDKPAELSVATGAGVLDCRVAYERGEASEIDISMGPAHLVADNLPSRTSGQPFIDQPLKNHPELRGTAVSMGNPHLVLFDVPLEEAARLGPILERHPDFPNRTNVELASVQGGGAKVVVWERGCGLTQACGTGACATVAAGVRTRRLPADEWVKVELPGGALRIWVAKDLSSTRLRGPATFVFEGLL
jgi:diaminopimelate epimerase